MIAVGLYRTHPNAFGDGTLEWMIGGHAHLGVLPILGFEWRRTLSVCATVRDLTLNSEYTASVDSTAEGESTDTPTRSAVGH